MFLARSGFPQDQHGGVSRRHGLDQAVKRVHGFAAPNHAVKIRTPACLLVGSDLAGEQVTLTRLIDFNAETLEIQGFTEKVVSTALEALHGHRDRGMGRNHEYRHGRELA